MVLGGAFLFRFSFVMFSNPFYTLLIGTLVEGLIRGISLTDTIQLKTEELLLPFKSLVGPMVAIFLLSLRSLTRVGVDPMIALPLGAITDTIVLR